MCLLNIVKLLLRPWDLDHAGGHAEQDEVSLYVQASDILHPACSVLKLQQMNAVHGHLKPVCLHQDLQLHTQTHYENFTGNSPKNENLLKMYLTDLEIFTILHHFLTNRSSEVNGCHQNEC